MRRIQLSVRYGAMNSGKTSMRINILCYAGHYPFYICGTFTPCARIVSADKEPCFLTLSGLSGDKAIAAGLKVDLKKRFLPTNCLSPTDS